MGDDTDLLDAIFRTPYMSATTEPMIRLTMDSNSMTWVRSGDSVNIRWNYSQPAVPQANWTIAGVDVGKFFVDDDEGPVDLLKFWSKI